MNATRKAILQELAGDVEKEIVVAEISIRYLAGIKIYAKEGELAAVQQNEDHYKKIKEELEKKLAIITDELAEHAPEKDVSGSATKKAKKGNS